MASRDEIKEAMRVSAEKGDMVTARKLQKMYDNYRLEGYTPQVMQDVQSIASDSMTRGFGPNDNADAARERQPGWIETPASIAGSVVGSPFKVVGKVGASVLGGVDSMIDEYGHQKNWIPGTDELYDIGKAGVVGSGLGAAGAWLGEKFGIGVSKGKDQPYPTDQKIIDAADEAKRLDPTSPNALDLEDRVRRLGEVRNAEKTGRDAFARLQAATPEEAAVRDSIANAPKPGITQVAETVDKYGKQVPPIPTIVMEALLSGGIPYKTLAGYAAKTALSKAGQAADMPNASQVEHLASLVRDPRGIGNTGTDQATIDFWRDRLSKLAIGAGKEF